MGAVGGGTSAAGLAKEKEVGANDYI